MARLLPIVFFWVSFGLAPLLAQQIVFPALPKTLRMGVVDLQEVLRNAQALLLLSADLGKQRRVLEATKRIEQQKIRREDQILSESRDSISEEDYAKRLSDLQQKVGQQQSMLQARTQTLNRRFNQEQARLQQAAEEIILLVARERGLHVVFVRPATLLVDTKLDLTQEIIRRLNKKYPQPLSDSEEDS